MVCFTGCTFPRRDLDSHKLSYAQYVLTLFKPWKDLRDLCGDGNWTPRLEEWLAVAQDEPLSCPQWVHRMLNNIHSLHEGEDKRKELRDENKRSRLNVLDEGEGRGYEAEDGYDDQVEKIPGGEEEDEEEIITDDFDFAPLVSARKSQEINFAEAGIECLAKAGWFFFIFLLIFYFLCFVVHVGKC